MEYQTAADPANLSDAEKKHVPVIEIEGIDVLVKVGEAPHPMEEGHLIEWIELYIGHHLLSRKNLKTGRKPEAAFHLKGEETNLSAVAFCNKHGAWKSEVLSYQFD